jgi:hypothetical protein
LSIEKTFDLVEFYCYKLVNHQFAISGGVCRLSYFPVSDVLALLPHLLELNVQVKIKNQK